MATNTTTHIEMKEDGVAWITGANTKVIEVVLHKIAYGWSPEEMHYQHPHLSMAQIHSALAYYYDHQEELDAEIENGLREVESLEKNWADLALRQKLLALKKSS